ncbi:hypothetical protein PCASD_00395 [Puccinia coronata f. sp. avenae]|uniref:Uncharacterized protein n=1 Tax=Puccinia coronata f. sp. avenae TaxID=200324 RepID=A0A2N5VNG6_9BASI|nr:hypothetical protein PCASD_00395 [Puccinia coronata f. sp. avenae]
MLTRFAFSAFGIYGIMQLVTGSPTSNPRSVSVTLHVSEGPRLLLVRGLSDMETPHSLHQGASSGGGGGPMAMIGSLTGGANGGAGGGPLGMLGGGKGDEDKGMEIKVGAAAAGVVVHWLCWAVEGEQEQEQEAVLVVHWPTGRFGWWRRAGGPLGMMGGLGGANPMAMLGGGGAAAAAVDL